MTCKAWLSLTAVSQWSVTIKPKQCALGENEGEGPFSMHTQRVIFIIQAFISAPNAAWATATLQWRNAQDVRFKANVVYKSNVIYVNTNTMWKSRTHLQTHKLASVCAGNPVGKEFGITGWRLQPGFGGVQGTESQNRESEPPCPDLLFSPAAWISPSLPTTCDMEIVIPLCWMRNLAS